MRKIKTAVFVSGRGSNLKALIKASDREYSNFSIVLVISDRDNPPAFEYAHEAGIATLTVEHQNRAYFGSVVDVALTEAGVELIALAGFMKILDGDFVKRWENRIINIHPSILPDFPGLNPHRQALEAGRSFTGASVHYVVPEVDAGPVIAQLIVPIYYGDDTEETLAWRIRQVEHRLYPICVEHVASRILEKS